MIFRMVEIESSRLSCRLAVLPKKTCTLWEMMNHFLSQFNRKSPKMKPLLNGSMTQKIRRRKWIILLIVGSNASALEATFNIMDISGIDDLINKFYFRVMPSIPAMKGQIRMIIIFLL
jgi:hypothetical protein